MIEKRIKPNPFDDKANHFIEELKLNQDIVLAVPSIHECAHYSVEDPRHTQGPIIETETTSGYDITTPSEELHRDVLHLAKTNLIIKETKPFTGRRETRNKLYTSNHTRGRPPKKWRGT